jgi:acyl dehydratase
MTLSFQDLTVGQTFESRAYPITADEVMAFARQYDPQPFHLDEAAAKKTFFQGLAASGWHTAAITMRLMVETMPVEGGLVGAGIEDFRWTQPVRPGDTLRLVSEILSLRGSKSKPHQGIARVRHTTLNQRQEPVQHFISTIILPRK